MVLSFDRYSDYSALQYQCVFSSFCVLVTLLGCECFFGDRIEGFLQFDMPRNISSCDIPPISVFFGDVCPVCDLGCMGNMPIPLLVKRVATPPLRWRSSSTSITEKGLGTAVDIEGVAGPGLGTQVVPWQSL